ncbi:ribbon-helix-helix, copG family protein [Rickettsia hoogstraalii str. RCCE3]|nr:ribbon-helix-helix, copG family protein [Rickettsia hoogstraalii str. RCCE3]
MISTRPKSITTSIRLEINLSKKLEKAAHDLHRGKSWIISKAIRIYLKQLENSDLTKEARRQSLLASKENNPDADLWLKHNEESWLDEWK